MRLNLQTWEAQGLRPDAKEGAPAFRFHWNSPFFISPHDPNDAVSRRQQGVQADRKGRQLEAISADLTTQHNERMITTGSSAETHCTIVSLAESTLQKGNSLERGRKSAQGSMAARQEQSL